MEMVLKEIMEIIEDTEMEDSDKVEAIKEYLSTEKSGFCLTNGHN